jgi:malate/lactate dehydrogenase
MRLVGQFIARYPQISGYDLIVVLEHMSRKVGVSRDSLLAAALVDRKSAEYLVGVVQRLVAGA